MSAEDNIESKGLKSVLDQESEIASEKPRRFISGKGEHFAGGTFRTSTIDSDGSETMMIGISLSPHQREEIRDKDMLKRRASALLAPALVDERPFTARINGLFLQPKSALDVIENLKRAFESKLIFEDAFFVDDHIKAISGATKVPWMSASPGKFRALPSGLEETFEHQTEPLLGYKRIRFDIGKWTRLPDNIEARSRLHFPEPHNSYDVATLENLFGKPGEYVQDYSMLPRWSNEPVTHLNGNKDILRFPL
ncbi:hypothetical protein [Acidisoma silvae]|uniref:Uncharacterized protein n=1 Tax=Acidisoma silvae TaxID=2802396 RepID=A0A963YNY3_9PROT|nr:hypothetical protein [Acidisoma silvae]MCB8873665.1 hypothetical protein [Acidisoma silvae]